MGKQRFMWCEEILFYADVTWKTFLYLVAEPSLFRNFMKSYHKKGEALPFTLFDFCWLLFNIIFVRVRSWRKILPIKNVVWKEKSKTIKIEKVDNFSRRNWVNCIRGLPKFNLRKVCFYVNRHLKCTYLISEWI